jgi:hypothetical protein
MKSISDYFEKPMFVDVIVATSEWNELIGIIVDKINAGRVGTIYKPVTPGMIVKKVKGFDTNTLRDFVTECKKSTCFSQCFYGKLKNLKSKKNPL